MTPPKPAPLLSRPPRVVNVGLAAFATDLRTAGAEVVHIHWSPPAAGNARIAALLAKLGA
ncbi:MAG TPA: hypothetical protein PK264_05515 [Hyphomicrobiaceae bacterium]|nr:hypothetical protein [Hyphomicrobiaceae bacterium]